MTAPFNKNDRLRIIQRVLNGEKVVSVCKEEGISRTVFYRWLNRYKEAPEDKKLEALEEKIQKVNKYFNQASKRREEAVLSVVRQYPEMSSHKIVEVLPKVGGKPLLGNHGVQNILKRLNLSTYEKRLEYKKTHPLFLTKSFTQQERLRIINKVIEEKQKVAKVCREANISRTIFYSWLDLYKKQHKPLPNKLSTSNRLQMIQRVKFGEPVTKICKLYGVSRTVFYKWLKRYDEAPQDKKNEALLDKIPFVSRYFNQAPEEHEEAVLAAVRQYPEMSSHKLVWVLPQTGGQPILGNHGIYNVLLRLGLNTYQSRLAYAKSVSTSNVAAAQRSVPQVSVDWRTPVFGEIPSLSGFASPPLIEKILTSKYFISMAFVISISFILSIVLSNLSFGQGLVGKIGILLAFGALFFGMFFFVYSIKYYLTIAIVLSFSRRKEEKKIEASGLEADLSKVVLQRHPFVSIHIATFNENIVIERLLKAVTSLQYDNPLTGEAGYEIVIADDSNDETTTIIQKFSEQWNPDSIGANKPIIKHIHRTSRSGFKGGALKGALEHTDPRAEYILIFDADFIPYPDTIVQFLKYFQATSQQLATSNQQSGDGQLKANQVEASGSNIAAIQGYQWHVLNKSENWITRGVRSEYSGSYVIERSGEEIYSGLKQISGSVYMIRKDVLSGIGWGTSITEDFELTLKLYEKGYKVVYTPYIQAPAEGVSTIKRLIRQRMRWAEGHSHNIRKMFLRLMFGKWDYAKGTKETQETKVPEGESSSFVSSGSSVSSGTSRAWIPSPLTLPEKLEFLYLSPYYLQAAFFIFGTLSWFIAEVIFKVRLPFWTEIWGWSLVFTNLLALPLLNMVGLFLEESDEKDYLGIFSFIVLSYIVAPFQGYAAIKGFLAKEEGPWFRTPKTGRITDTFMPERLYRFVSGIFGSAKPGTVQNPAKQNSPATLSTTNNSRIATNSYLALVTAGNSFSNFRIKRRTIRWLGNISLVILITTNIMLISLAPFIPYSQQASASTRRFQSLANRTKAASSKPIVHSTDGKIENPIALRFGKEDDKALEYIFHPEPRVRTKLNNKQIETTLISSDMLGKADPKHVYRKDGIYIWEDVFSDIDLHLIPSKGSLREEIILKKYQDFHSMTWYVQLTDLVAAQKDNQVYFAPQEGGNPLFKWSKPYLYEKNNAKEKSYGVEFYMQKTAFGWEIKKVLTQEGKKWLGEASRQFPVVLDPTQFTSIIEDGTIAADESDYGQWQRKIVYANNALNGAAWYVVYEDASSVFFEKCLASSNCDANADWTNRTDIDGGDADNNNPSVWWESDRAKVWIAWIDVSQSDVEFRDLDVDASDPGTQGTLCSNAGADNITTFVPSIAVAADDDVFIVYFDQAAGKDPFIYKIAAGGCTFTDITAGSGLTTRGDPGVIVTVGNTAHLIFQDGQLSHSVDNDDGGTLWDRSNTTISTNTSDNFAVATDNTSVWVIIDQGTSGADLWTCSSCTSSTTWTDSADPWASQSTDITEVSIVYISGSTELAALALQGSGSTEKVITKGTNASTISWGTETNLGSFGAGASGLEDLSSTMNATADTGVGVVVNEISSLDYEFSTLPENLWLLFLGLSVIVYLLKRHKRKIEPHGVSLHDYIAKI